jgi:hypothetical protein
MGSDKSNLQSPTGFEAVEAKTLHLLPGFASSFTNANGDLSAARAKRKTQNALKTRLEIYLGPTNVWFVHQRIWREGSLHLQTEFMRVTLSGHEEPPVVSPTGFDLIEASQFSAFAF